jgi:hypothetical protein
LSPVFTPTIAYRKGLGNFDVQGTFGGACRPEACRSSETLCRGITHFSAKSSKTFGRTWRRISLTITVGAARLSRPANPGQTLVYLAPGLALARFRVKDRLSFTLEGAVLRWQRRHFIPPTTFPCYGYASPSEAVGRNPGFHINPVRIGK